MSRARSFGVLGTLLGAVAVLALYFTVPLASAEIGAVGRILATLALLAVFTFAIMRVRQHGTNIPLLVLLLVLVAAAFAAIIFVIAMNRPGEFQGIETRMDALYFILTTMTTTGYGDVHASGQTARMLVSGVLVFDLVFLGLVAAEISRIAGRRRRSTTDEAIQ